MKLRIFRLISLDACRFYKKTAFPEICIRPSVIWKSHLMLLIVVIIYASVLSAMGTNRSQRALGLANMVDEEIIYRLAIFGRSRHRTLEV